MHRNRLVQLLILAAALNFSACGGAAERTDRKAAGEATASNASSPATANGGATTVAASSNAGKADAAPSGKAVAQQSPSPAPVTPGAGGAPPAKAPTPHIGSGGNDFFLFTQARGAINNDPELKGANVVVEVKEGVVTLSGAVASAALKSKAEQIARGAGARDVKNQLRVSAGR